MTASATSSSVVLLTSPVDPAKAAAPSAAKASSDAGGDGFQLLLAQAAEDVRAIAEPVKLLGGAKTDNVPSDGQTSSDDGNDLPLLAGLLPPGQVIPATDSKVGGDEKPSADGKGSKHRKGDADGAILLSTMLPAAQSSAPVLPVVPAMPAVPAPVQPSTNENAAASAAQPDVAAVAAANGAGAGLFAQTQKNDAAQRATEVGSKTALGHADTDNLQISTPAAASATPAARGIAELISTGLEGAASRKPGDSSDFDTLIKQLDAPGSTVTANTGAVDSGRSLQQANRPFAETNTGAATVSVPVGAQGWSDAVTDKVMWFSANKFNSAEIHLNPPDLGPLQVRISTEHDQTSVYFTSPHAAVRDALDQALPRLRDMLGSQGMQLLDVGVGGQGAAQQQFSRGNANDNARSAKSGFFSDMVDTAEPVAVSTVTSARLLRSGIDAYA